MEPKLFVATKAFIVYNRNVLILRESTQYVDGTNAGRWDVAGGRVKPGERFDHCLLREIREETGLCAKLGRPFSVSEWRPVVKGEQWQIVATFFECFSDSGEVTLSEDHDRFLWIDPRDYKTYDVLETNVPAFEDYLSRYNV